jgi:GntR family transcriptional regulator/MocR family aminotransferase
MSISRKKELINFINKTDSLIIEDDFDSEFRINGQRSSSIYSLDRDRVIFFSSFTTTMYPGIRLAYMILPDKLLKLYNEKYEIYSSSPTLEQLMLKEFIKNGGYAAHINKIKRLYLKKRQLILKILKDYNYIKADDKKCYLSIPLKINSKYNDEEIISILKNNNIKITMLSNYDINKKNSKTIILGYTSIPYEKIDEGLRLLGIHYLDEM